MKTGLIYGLIVWVASLLVMPFLAPFLAPGGDMRSMGRSWLFLSLLVVGVPAFLFGYWKQRKG